MKVASATFFLWNLVENAYEDFFKNKTWLTKWLVTSFSNLIRSKLKPLE